MAIIFTPRQINIEEWLEAERDNLLQKICNVFDDDGLLIEQYKTRVYTVPIGNYLPLSNTIVQLTPAPSLYRAFSYDDEGNSIASIPEVREWTQACEDAAQGAIPGDPGDTGVPAGLKLAKSTYEYISANSVAAGATVIVGQKQLLPDEAIYLRHVPISGCNRSRFTVNVDGSPLQAKKLWWTKFSDDMWFNTANGGILFEDEELITVVVTNNGDDAADFEASIGFVIK